MSCLDNAKHGPLVSEGAAASDRSSPTMSILASWQVNVHVTEKVTTDHNCMFVRQK